MGLRDVHAIDWAAAAGAVPSGDQTAMRDAYEALLEVRTALHRVTRRPGDRLTLQDQDAVAEFMGLASADALMTMVAQSGRTIAWRSDEFWFDTAATRSIPRPVRCRATVLERGVSLHDGRIVLDAVAEGGGSPSAVEVLRAARLAAQHGARFEADSLAAIGNVADPPAPWSPELRAAFTDFLAAGPYMVGVAEALDHAGFWARLIPEWSQVRSRPQRNAYHRFTVDRHLLETARGAAGLAELTTRPDLLVVGALLHDIGKGFLGDHTSVGVELMAVIGARMGFAADDIETLQFLIQQHLLLPDVATRRDLDDPATIARVATAVQTPERLRLLHALTEADSLATGPAAWGRSKAGLVSQLVERTDRVLSGALVADVVEVAADDRWSPMVDRCLATGEFQVDALDDRIVVASPDRPGLFGRVAGTLALSGLEVVSASATSERGVAVEEFRVATRFDTGIDWDRVTGLLSKALGDRLALSMRLAERALSYPDAPPQPASIPPGVVIDQAGSEVATVIEVTGPDSVGLLFRLTATLAELGLNLLQAKVVTLGTDVVDVFYVTDSAGEKVADADHLAEIERALLFALQS